MSKREKVAKALARVRGNVSYGEFGKRVDIHPRALAQILKSLANESPKLKKMTKHVVSKKAKLAA